MRKLTIYGVIAVMMAVLVIGPSLLISTSAPVVEANAGTQWNAQYWNNISLSGTPTLTRIDDQINFNWGTGSPKTDDPNKINSDNFSARWTKSVNFPNAGKWTFRVGADDGVRMWIDVTPIVDEWHGNAEGYKTYEVSIDTLTAGNHDLKVEYYEATGNAGVKVEWSYAGTTTTTGGGGSASWAASYFNNTDLSGSAVLTRTDSAINFNWAAGSPGSGVNADNFSARWTATVNFPTPGQWRFVAGADDGIRMWIDVTQIIDEWHGNAEGYRSYSVDVYALTAGNHDLKVEYFEATGNAGVQVKWEYIGAEGTGGGGVSTPGVPTATPIPPATVYAAATADNINVRSGPGLGNPVVGRLTYEENYIVLAGVPDLSWLQIDLENGSTGWVSNDWVWLYAVPAYMNEDSTGGGQPDFVDKIPRVDIPIAPPASLPKEDPLRITLTGRATDNVNLRDGATLYSSKIIGSVPQNATVTVEAHNGNGAWYLINYQGIRGWVSALYVDLLDGTVSQLVVSSEVAPAPPPGAIFVPETEEGEYVTARGRAIDNLKLRDAASLRGNDIGSIPLNAEFVIEGRNSTGAWFLITWEGVQGWIYSPYVALIEGRVSDLPIR